MRILPPCLAFLLWTTLPLDAQKSGGVTVWLTNSDRSALFDPVLPPRPFERPRNESLTITVDDHQTYQTIDGFGFALTGDGARRLIRMDADKRAALLQELFGTDGKDIGISYLRVSVGASDASGRVYTYDDLPAGQTDPTMAKFSLDEDSKDVIPVLKEILRVNPAIGILGSPWTAPSWMKSNNSPKGGTLKPEFYDAYARYFVKYLQGMRAAGIRIDAVTVQNEPRNGQDTPSMTMQAPEEAEFIGRHLGPALRKAHIKTRIVLYDGDCDTPEYATSILANPQASRYADASGFHLDAGREEVMSQVHKAYPRKSIYCIGQIAAPTAERRGAIDAGDPVRRLIVGATRNWSGDVLLGSLAVAIDGNNVTRDPAYYAMAQASRFVRPGSVRIASNNLETLPNVAFKTRGGGKVLIVVNAAAAEQTFNIHYRNAAVVATLKAGAVGTYVW